MLTRWMLALLVALGAGCSSTETLVDADPIDDTRPSDVTITSADGTVFQGDPAIVRAYEGLDAAVQLSLWGGHDTGDWQATGAAALETLDAGAFSLDARKLPLAPGIANVSRRYGGDESTWEFAEDGTLSLQLADGGRFSGSAEVGLPALDATFEGRFVFECLVFRETLGLPPNGQGSEGVIEHVLDEQLESAFCQRFARWRE